MSCVCMYFIRCMAWGVLNLFFNAFTIKMLMYVHACVCVCMCRSSESECMSLVAEVVHIPSFCRFHCIHVCIYSMYVYNYRLSKATKKFTNALKLQDWVWFLFQVINKKQNKVT